MSLQFDVFLIEKKGMGNEEHIFSKNSLLLNNVISIIDLFKILTYYIDNKKIFEIRNYNNKDNIFLK